MTPIIGVLLVDYYKENKINEIGKTPLRQPDKKL